MSSSQVLKQINIFGKLCTDGLIILSLAVYCSILYSINFSDYIVYCGVNHVLITAIYFRLLNGQLTGIRSKQEPDISVSTFVLENRLKLLFKTI